MSRFTFFAQPIPYSPEAPASVRSLSFSMRKYRSRNSLGGIFNAAWMRFRSWWKTLWRTASTASSKVAKAEGLPTSSLNFPKRESCRPFRHGEAFALIDGRIPASVRKFSTRKPRYSLHWSLWRISGAFPTFATASATAARTNSFVWTRPMAYPTTSRE